MGMLEVSFELSKDPMAFIDIINASKIYGTRHVLDHVNLSDRERRVRIDCWV